MYVKSKQFLFSFLVYVQNIKHVEIYFLKH